MGSLILAGLIDAAKKLLSKYFKSEDEQKQAEITLAQLQEQPQLLQLMINLAEAKSNKFFVAGWRPFIGWSVGVLFGIGCLYDLLIYPILTDCGIKAIQVELGPLLSALGALLGFGSLRTYDKKMGTTITYGEDLGKTKDT